MYIKAQSIAVYETPLYLPYEGEGYPHNITDMVKNMTSTIPNYLDGQSRNDDSLTITLPHKRFCEQAPLLSKTDIHKRLNHKRKMFLDRTLETI